MSSKDEENTTFFDLFVRREKIPWILLLVNFLISFLQLFLGNVTDDKYGKLPNFIALTLSTYILTFLSINVYLKMSGRGFFVGGSQGRYTEKKYDKKGYIATLYIATCCVVYLILVIKLLFYP